MLEELIKQIVKETIEETLSKIDMHNFNKSSIPDVMNVDQLASYLGISKSWVYKNVNDLPKERIGKKLVFHRYDVDIWKKEKIESQEQIIHIANRKSKCNYKVV